ncbi:WD40-repeat-containing domain protein [Phycomyces nitens]|nr:WD40-repeat-containing domain protein [Phycomyces nitens]
MSYHLNIQTSPISSRSSHYAESPSESPVIPANRNWSHQEESFFKTHCVHTISQDDCHSVLSLTANDRYLFSGSQGSIINVWDLHTFSLVTELKGHCGSILGLVLSLDREWLFSCSGDGTVRVWDTETFKCLFLIRSCHDVGDVFSLVFTKQAGLLFLGCQDTSIQWYDLDDLKNETKNVSHNKVLRPKCQKSRFFDNVPGINIDNFEYKDTKQCVVREKNVLTNAHDGYVYCLVYSNDVPNIDGEVLISGSGDGDVKIWLIKNKALQLLHGEILQIWDLETYQMIRSIKGHSDDVLSVSVKETGFISASADGRINLWSEGFELEESIDQDNGILLSLTQTRDYIVTGGTNHTIKFWHTQHFTNSADNSKRNSSLQDINSGDMMLSTLEKWISMRTVSGIPKYSEECRKGARFLKNLFQTLGAQSRMIPGASGRNPLVYGKFFANQTQSGKDIRDGSFKPFEKAPTVLIYGHYDVISAENAKGLWESDPFKLSGRNGYLYGRGTSDNKGPILACIFAVHELLKQGNLDVNVLFLIEGEEENGSVGFQEALDEQKTLFEDVDVVLLSNSYWLGEDVPCLTYGLRGVVHASITVCNGLADLHSGVEGGAMSEPLVDLIHVLGKLIDPKKRVLVPGFYNDIRPITSAEDVLYDPIVKWLQKSTDKPPDSTSTSRSQHSCITPSSFSDSGSETSEYMSEHGLKQQLMVRWRYPTLSVHKIDVSINNPTVIPRNARAVISMRVVPDQSISDICDSFKSYTEKVFQETRTENKILVQIESSADYWLGNPENKYFKAAEDAIKKEWQIKPLYIREGGSIPAVRLLERFCNAPAIHLPMVNIPHSK